jgi:hypothetical protein
VNVHESVEVPEPVTLVSDRVHAALFAVSATMPANPLTGVTVIVEVATEPTLTFTVVGLAERVKSWNE